jgi:hypothetical protein
MVAAAYFQPKFEQNHLGRKLINLATDTLVVGLIASGTLATRTTSEGYEYVSDLLANGGSSLTEVSTSSTGYTRQNLSGVTLTVSGLTTVLNSSNPAWPSATFTANYAWIHDETASSSTDATRPLLAIFDFGGPQTVAGTEFTLTVNASGLISWVAAA